MPSIDNTLLWIVFKQCPRTGVIEDDSAWLSEDTARDHARAIIGKDDWLIGLRTIRLKDHITVYSEKT